MKKYEPKVLVAISRYQNYFPSLSAQFQRDVYARMDELLIEEKAYCDKGNYAHMAQILTSDSGNHRSGKGQEHAWRGTHRGRLREAALP